ncbi:MAG TPA: hypothetical protein VHN78_02075, partial [Chloroflexota bacterium]|nr:hypothetical protein [Chloroflexota bacterium]
LYAMRDRGELTRQDLLTLFCHPPTAGGPDVEIEVAGVPGHDARRDPPCDPGRHSGNSAE